MLTKDVRVGGIYRMFLDGYPTVVKLSSEHPRGGWNARNLQTGGNLWVRTAALLGPTYLPYPPSAHVDGWSD